MKFRKSCFIFWLSILSLTSVFAQTPGGRGGLTTIRVVSEAVVSSPADRTQLVVDHFSQGDTPAQAADLNQQEYDRVTALFRKRLGKDVEFETLRMNFNTSMSMGGSTQTGTPAPQYFVERRYSIQLKVNDFGLVTRAMGIAMEANIKPTIQYTSSTQDKARVEAIRQATVKAREKAEATATALGMKVIHVVSIEEIPTPDYVVQQGVYPGSFTPVKNAISAATGANPTGDARSAGSITSGLMQQVLVGASVAIVVEIGS